LKKTAGGANGGYCRGPKLSAGGVSSGSAKEGGPLSAATQPLGSLRQTANHELKGEDETEVVKSFMLVVNEKEYNIEIGDLSESPLIVVVNGEA